jgi:hypothetical protein
VASIQENLKKGIFQRKYPQKRNFSKFWVGDLKSMDGTAYPRKYGTRK